MGEREVCVRDRLPCGRSRWSGRYGRPVPLLRVGGARGRVLYDKRGSYTFTVSYNLLRLLYNHLFVVADFPLLVNVADLYFGGARGVSVMKGEGRDEVWCVLDDANCHELS